MKYVVIARKWNSVTNKSENYVAGSFDDVVNAEIFKEAYEKAYSANAEIKEIKYLINL